MLKVHAILLHVFDRFRGIVRRVLIGIALTILLFASPSIAAQAEDPLPPDSAATIEGDPQNQVTDGDSEPDALAPVVEQGDDDATADQPQEEVAADPTAPDIAGDLEDSDAADVAVEEPEIVPMAVPAPDGSNSVVTVKTGGYRSGSTTISPLPGAQLALYSSLSAGTPFNTDWGICTSDADGDCSFTIPATNLPVDNGGNRDRELYVKVYSAPIGYSQHIAEELGAQDGTGQGFGSSASEPIDAKTYGFRVGEQSQNGWRLRSGQTYYSGGSNADFMLSASYGGTASGGVFQFVRDNPVIDVCGLDVALVLDLSGSVAGQEDQLAGAADALVDALTGTNSSMSLYSFSTSSPARAVTDRNDAGTVLLQNRPQQQSVSTAAGAQSVKNWYSNGSGDASFSVSGATNWDRAMWQVIQSGNDYDVAVVITDGNPTVYGAPPVEGPGGHTRFRDVEAGIFSANAIKDAGTRVVAVGVGSGVNSTESGLNLAAISGPVEGSDFFQTTNYAQAGEALREMVADSCSGTVTVVKQVVPEGTEGEDVTGASPAGGWTFTASSSDPTVTLPGTGTTANDTGAVNFPLEFPDGSTTTTLTFAETQQDGHALVTQGGFNAVCRDLTTGDTLPVTNSGELGFVLEDVGPSANVSCTVYNRPDRQLEEATVEVDKVWIVNGVRYQQGSQPTGLTASLRLSGPGDAPLTGQPWGQVRSGYQEDDTVTFDESTQIDPVLVGCTLISQRVTLDNGQVVDEAVPYSATLQGGANEYEITNTVDCVSKLTLVKQVVGGEASPAEWDLTAYTVPDDPQAGSLVPGFDGAESTQLVDGSWGVTNTIEPGTYQFAEANGPAEYHQRFGGNSDVQAATRPLSTGSWYCTHVNDQLQPVDSWSDGLNGGAVVQLGSHVACTAYNLTTEVTVLKHVRNDNGGLLSADQWQLTATPNAGVDGLEPAEFAGDEQITDLNTFYALPLHQYALSETSAEDLAYAQVAVQVYVGDIGDDGTVDHDDDSLWQDVDPSSITVPEDEQAHVVYRFVNADIPAVALPVSGGTGNGMYVATGTLLGLLTLAGGAWVHWRQRFGRRR